MRFTVQYIPLRKIRPDLSVRLTRRIRMLRLLMWDCMHLIAVRKHRMDGSYIVVSGHDRYDYLRKHTKKKFAPCIVDESKASSLMKSLLLSIRSKPMPDELPYFKHKRLRPKSRSIIGRFIQSEPRFNQLARGQQLKVLLLAVRYKKTVVGAMRSKVDEMLSER
ncbi:hypothetical protein AB6A23_07040 [Paenibacillus tarimensis]